MGKSNTPIIYIFSCLLHFIFYFPLFPLNTGYFNNKNTACIFVYANRCQISLHAPHPMFLALAHFISIQCMHLTLDAYFAYKFYYYCTYLYWIAGNAAATMPSQTTTTYLLFCSCSVCVPVFFLFFFLYSFFGIMQNENLQFFAWHLFVVMFSICWQLPNI